MGAVKMAGDCGATEAQLSFCNKNSTFFLQRRAKFSEGMGKANIYENAPG
jgi:hypothetical protein